MLSWDDHHLVLTLARSGTLAATASRLGVNETTVARRLAAVEAAAGSTLFRRVDRRLEPSASGDAILVAAEAMERALADLVEARHAMSGTVRVSAVAAVVDHLVVPYLGDFVARYPGLILELVASNANASLARREADVAIRLARPERGKLVARRLGFLRYRLAGTSDPVQDEAASGGYLAFDREMDELPEMRAIRGRFNGPPRARIGSLSGMRTAAEAGLGAAMLPDWMIAASNKLRVIDPQMSAERPVWLVVHEDLKDRPAVRTAMDWLATTISSALA